MRLAKYNTVIITLHKILNLGDYYISFDMVAVKDFMQKQFVGVSRTTKVDSAHKLAEVAKVDLMPVVEDERLCGIITSANLEKNLGKGSEVGKVMDKPIFIEADARLEDAAGVMIEYGVGRVPVVENKYSMICVGVVTSTDIVNAYKKS